MDLTVSQLEKMIETQKNRVRDLNVARESLLEQISEVDSQISELLGTKVSKEEIGMHERATIAEFNDRHKVRHRKGKRLIDYIVDSLKNSPATLDDLAEDVVGSGYKFRAKNPCGSIATAIYNHRREGNDNVRYHRGTKTYSV